MSPPDYHCAGCNKPPEKLPDIVEAAALNRMTPSAYVQVLEPTFNRASGRFMCQDCYMEAGISDPAWRAP
jgi:hypothetical protein